MKVFLALIIALFLFTSQRAVFSTPQEVVVLAHGYDVLRNGDGTSAWVDYKVWLEQAGYKVVVLDFTNNNVYHNAIQVQAAVNAVPSATPVHLIGHSMGGLSARYCVKYLQGCNRVESYSSLDTPQQGAWIFCWNLDNDGGLMCPWKWLVTALNAGDDTPGITRYYQYNISAGMPMDGGVTFIPITGDHSLIVHDFNLFNLVLSNISR